ncbi:uncharacterized protein DNG_02517 [Cephalotrichum gorgonifer]|uniref:Uncharacterized protein n=1 Tax=Cephalotrichum gorgonifer TaxID=2041049 RepID=A0AAE8ST54_9PEZI|nr:uncharacterized protein DNG_02517 [Cephalotrichum gorgonifer]
MLPLAHPVLLLALAAGVDAIKFTKPEAGTNLDLSSTITISWELEGSEEQFDQINIEFVYGPPNSDSLSWEIATNLTLADGTYDWDPREVHRLLTNGDHDISGGKNTYFGVRLHDEGELAGFATMSGMYAMEGHENSAHGNTIWPAWMAVTMSGLLAAGVFFF